MNAITHDFVIRHFEYNPETGELFRSGNRNGYKEKRLIKIVVNKDGYRMTYINGKSVRVHRLIWFIVHGEWPSGGIDHINGRRDDNRLCNLRVVSQMINCQNRRNAKGICFSKSSQKWVAKIIVNKKYVFLGRYSSEYEARKAYLYAKSRLHPLAITPVS